MIGTRAAGLASGTFVPLAPNAVLSGAGLGQSCVPWLEPGLAPAGQENVGVCSVASRAPWHDVHVVLVRTSAVVTSWVLIACGPVLLVALTSASACGRRTLDADADAGGTGATTRTDDPSSGSASATGQDDTSEGSTTGDPVPSCGSVGGEALPLPGEPETLGWIRLPGGDPEVLESLSAVAYAPAEDAFYAVGSRTTPRPGDKGDSMRISVAADGTIRCIATAGLSDSEAWNRDHDIAVLPNGELVIASERNVRPLVARTDPEWQVLAEEQYLIEPGMEGYAGHVAVGDRGATRVVGRQTLFMPFSYDSWGREYAPSEPPANEVWQAETYPRSSDFYGPLAWSTAANQWFSVQEFFDPGDRTQLLGFDPGTTQPTVDEPITSELEFFNVHAMVATSSAVVVCGDGANLGEDHERVWIAAYSFAGMQEWSVILDGTDGRAATCYGIAHDEHEDLVVVGGEYDEIDGERIGPGTIRKLDPGGTERWFKAIEPDGYTVTRLIDVTVGRDGQIVAVGATSTAETSTDPIIVSVGP